MKTKKLFLMAAMLLASVCAFAQSVNNASLRGDVNGDGKIDIADVTELVNIILNKTTPTPQVTYYFSIGTTPVTADNYTTANNATTTIPTITRYTSTERNYHYILIPSNKTMTIVADSDSAPINITEQTSISIPNHKVYKTNGPLNVGGTVRITLS